MTPAPAASTAVRARGTRVLAAAVAIAAGAALAPGAAHAGGGGSPYRVDIGLSAAGPGTMLAGPLSIRDQAFVWTTDSRSVTFTARQDGMGEFAGWQGACAAEGTNDTCVIQTDCSSGAIAACSVGGFAALATPERCIWVGAAFRTPGEQAPAIANPCNKEVPGGGGGGGGGGGSTPGGGSGTPGSGSGSGGQAAPKPGTTLPGGVTTVRRAPALRGARITVTAGRVSTSGTAPRGSARVVQSAALVGNAGVSVAGRCRLMRATGAFTCTAPTPRGRWTVITQARRGSEVLAQTTRTVRVR